MKQVTPAQINSRLLALARTLNRDFHGLSIEFAIERLISRLIIDIKLSKHLIFKGGYVMLKAYASSRATIDLDTSIQGIGIEEAEARAIKMIDGLKDDGLWMGSIVSEDLEHQTKYSGRRLTVRFAFGTPKVNAQRLGKIILDIGVGDVITPKPVADDLKPLLGGELISWSIYPIETIIAEKLHALISHGSANSRAKDIYDLTVLLKKVDQKTTLRKAINLTFKHRSTPMPDSFSDYWIALDKTMLRRASGAILLSSGESVNFSELESELASLLKRI